MPAPTHQAVENEVLNALPRQDLERLLSGLELVTLTYGEILYEPGDPIHYVYFPLDSLVSLLTLVDGHLALEVGMVGYEGMVGTPITLGVMRSSVRALVQGTGTALRMSAVRFRLEFRKSSALQRALYHYVHMLMAQVTQTAACNRFHQVHSRLARWLLMTRDRLRSEQFHLTQEFLACMLGVRRVGVTKAASALQRKKLIRYTRGQIRILDGAALEAAACACYRIVRDLSDHAQGNGHRPRKSLRVAPLRTTIVRSGVTQVAASEATPLLESH